MKKTINLYWLKHKKGNGNFGDELNPYIIQKLCDSEIKYIDARYINDNKLSIIKNLIINIFEQKISFQTFIKSIYYNFFNKPHLFFAIGSILHICQTKNATIWGSGIISKDSNIPNANYLAVRGKKTAERIKELGYLSPKIYGDPGLLLPLVYKTDSNKKYKVGIIPHYIHYEYYLEKMGDNFFVINLLDKIEDIIDQINQCDLTISTSLHGIIVSHAYNIKSIWARNAKNKLYGDDIKFSDYFSSVNINEYSPIEMDALIESKPEIIYDNIINKYNTVLQPDEYIIDQIQKQLITVFPYDINNPEIIEYRLN